MYVPAILAARETSSQSAAIGERIPRFTTKFDLEVRAERLQKVMGFVDEATFRRYVAEFDRAMTEWRARADLAAVETLPRVRAAGGFDPRMPVC